MVGALALKQLGLKDALAVIYHRPTGTRTVVIG